MTVYTATPGSSLNFSPGVDSLRFSAGSAAQLVFAASGSDLLLGLGSADIRLLATAYADLFASSVKPLLT